MDILGNKFTPERHLHGLERPLTTRGHGERMKGYLHRRNERFGKIWHKRYYALGEDGLQYWMSEKDSAKTPRGKFDFVEMRSVRCTGMEANSWRCKFELQMDTYLVLEFYCDTRVTCESWVASIGRRLGSIPNQTVPQASPVINSVPPHAGVLQEQSTSLLGTVWHSRYFLLDEHNLLCWESEKDSRVGLDKLKGSITLSNIRNLLSRGDTLEIVMNTYRVIMLRAESVEECLEWVSAINVRIGDKLKQPTRRESRYATDLDIDENNNQTLQGYLEKRSHKDGASYYKRYFVLDRHNLSYWRDEKDCRSGEKLLCRMLPCSEIDEIEISLKAGNCFSIKTKSTSELGMDLKAVDDAECNLWVSTLRGIIKLYRHPKLAALGLSNETLLPSSKQTEIAFAVKCQALGEKQNLFLTVFWSNPRDTTPIALPKAPLNVEDSSCEWKELCRTETLPPAPGVWDHEFMVMCTIPIAMPRPIQSEVPITKPATSSPLPKSESVAQQPRNRKLLQMVPDLFEASSSADAPPTEDAKPQAFIDLATALSEVPLDYLSSHIRISLFHCKNLENSKLAAQEELAACTCYLRDMMSPWGLLRDFVVFEPTSLLSPVARVWLHPLTARRIITSATGKGKCSQYAHKSFVFPLSPAMQNNNNSSGAVGALMVHEQLQESPLSFQFAMSYLEWRLCAQRRVRARLLLELMDQPEAADKAGEDLVERYAESILRCQRLLKIYNDYHNSGVRFKATTSRANPVFRYVGTNLHVHTISIIKRGGHEGDEDWVYLFDTVTMGAPAAHDKGFKEGGLTKLAKSLKKVEEEVQGEKLQVRGTFTGGVITLMPPKYVKTYFEFTRREETVLAQLLAGVGTAVACRILRAIDNPALATQIANLGVLVQIESLLSTFQDENGMLSDFYHVVKRLAGMTIQVVSETMASLNAALDDSQAVADLQHSTQFLSKQNQGSRKLGTSDTSTSLPSSSSNSNLALTAALNSHVSRPSKFLPTASRSELISQTSTTDLSSRASPALAPEESSFSQGPLHTRSRSHKKSMKSGDILEFDQLKMEKSEQEENNHLNSPFNSSAILEQRGRSISNVLHELSSSSSEDDEPPPPEEDEEENDEQKFSKNTLSPGRSCLRVSPPSAGGPSHSKHVSSNSLGGTSPLTASPQGYGQTGKRGIEVEEDKFECDLDLSGVRMELLGVSSGTVDPWQPLERLTARLILPDSVYARLPDQLRFNKRNLSSNNDESENGDEEAEGMTFPLTCALITQGVNEMQSVAITLGSQEVGIQQEINKEGFAALSSYATKFLLHHVHDAHKRAALSGALDNLRACIENQRNDEKNTALLLNAATAARELGAARMVCCKSAKDRTSMSVTWEQAVILNKLGLPTELSQRVMDAMREEGVRRGNVLKNTGSLGYAFNGFQRSMLPSVLCPPLHTCGDNVT